MIESMQVLPVSSNVSLLRLQNRCCTSNRAPFPFGLEKNGIAVIQWKVRSQQMEHRQTVCTAVHHKSDHRRATIVCLEANQGECGEEIEDSGSEAGPVSCSPLCWEDNDRGKRRREVGAGINGGLRLFSVAPLLVYPGIAEGTGYSQASYYTSLGLFIISVPGLWSLIKRSTKSKVVKKIFSVPGPSDGKGKPANQIAGEITAFFTRSNFVVANRGDTVTFEGTMTPSRGQAAFLSTCTAISLASVGLVLSITVPDVGEKWYWLTILSPLAGFYYWTRASRKEQIQVKMVVADDEGFTDVIVQGDDEEVDRLRRELQLMEKGMVYVKGIFER